MSKTIHPFARAMTLAALSGSKIALGPAFLAAARRRPGGQAWAAAALGEMVLDKLGGFPGRFRPSLLIPHTISGAWVAHESMKEDGVSDPWAAPMGAVVAAGVASVAPMVRIAANRILGIPDWTLGLAEDYIALQAGSQAMNMTMDEVAGFARGSVEEVGGRVMPALEAVGVDLGG